MNKADIQQIVNDIELDLITLLFATLKLCSVIHWNWFWVFLPVIFEFAVHLLVFFINKRRSE